MAKIKIIKFNKDKTIVTYEYRIHFIISAIINVILIGILSWKFFF